jgi:hypothetical protein
MSLLWIKEWERFQHYKQRNPPWIKLYRSLLDDLDYLDMPPEARLLLIDLWLLASESDGCVKYDSVWLARRLRLASITDVHETLQTLALHGFIITEGDDDAVASGSLAERERQKRREEERRVETEERREDTSLVVLEPQPEVGRLPARQGRALTDVQSHVEQALAAVRADAGKRLAVDQVRVVLAEVVFAYWAAKTQHERSLFDEKRQSRLVARLRENSMDVNELLYAVDGWFLDPTFQRLARDENRVLDGIENIFANRERVERLARHCDGYRKQLPHPFADQCQALAEEIAR